MPENGAFMVAAYAVAAVVVVGYTLGLVLRLRRALKS